MMAHEGTLLVASFCPFSQRWCPLYRHGCRVLASLRPTALVIASDHHKPLTPVVESLRSLLLTHSVMFVQRVPPDSQVQAP